MNERSHAHWLLIFCAAAQLVIAWPAHGDETNSPQPQAASLPYPPYPPGYSPVDLFRQLLAMSPDERDNYLAGRPPEIRDRLLEKIQEYLALDPDERELRLRATELRWFLLPLMRDPPARRETALAQVPDRVRDLVKARLLQWEILPPELQQEFLENERTVHYLAHATNSPSAEDASFNTPTDEELTQWKSLSAQQRNILASQFNQFFELTPDEKQQALNTLSDAERAQMEKTLQSFATLSADQRLECIRAFNEFANMSPQDRAAFLKNAERWSQLSPKERQAWRDLVADVPQWPPFPPGALNGPLNNHPTAQTHDGTNLN
ncbi:MAG TPA: DUF3106 domain-containing protein [Verrucomicrobiae bacterium]|jgi:hypothetical protein